jgi:hypothetical protein
MGIRDSGVVFCLRVVVRYTGGGGRKSLMEMMKLMCRY